MGAENSVALSSAFVFAHALRSPLRNNQATGSAIIFITLSNLVGQHGTSAMSTGSICTLAEVYLSTLIFAMYPIIFKTYQTIVHAYYLCVSAETLSRANSVLIQ